MEGSDNKSTNSDGESVLSYHPRLYPKPRLIRYSVDHSLTPAEWMHKAILLEKYEADLKFG